MSKHDAYCLRRKAELGWLYLCTCSLLDEQVREALEGRAEDPAREDRDHEQQQDPAEDL
jgi:hypothetical protein